MLMANPETGAPDVICRLDLRGPHAISIGIHPSDIGQIDWHNATGDVVWLRARLTGDQSFSVLEWDPGGHLKRRRLEEIFWKVADLTDQEITFSQYGLRAGTGAHPELGDHAPARIAYIKLVPLTEEEAALVRADRADRSHKRLQGHTDISNVLRAGTIDAIREELESYRDSDFDRIHWELGSGDLMNYPSRIGRTLDQIEPPDYGRKWDRYLHEGWNRLITAGIDPFGEAVSYAHGMGLGFHAAYRLAGWTYPPPLLDYAFADGLYDRHPEWRCKDRDGRDQARLSYAFPEVQEYCISVLREVVRAYPVDGITLLYNRRPPYLDYEEPLTTDFQAATGRDPFQIPADDPEWLRYRAAVLTVVHAARAPGHGRRGRRPWSAGRDLGLHPGQHRGQSVLRRRHGRVGARRPGGYGDAVQQRSVRVAGSHRHLERPRAGAPVRGRGRRHRLPAGDERHAAVHAAGRLPPHGEDALRRRQRVPVLLGQLPARPPPRVLERAAPPGPPR